MDIEKEIAEALRRIRKNIERRYQLATGRAVKTTNRSVGQLFKTKRAK